MAELDLRLALRWLRERARSASRCQGPVAAAAHVRPVADGCTGAREDVEGSAPGVSGGGGSSDVNAEAGGSSFAAARAGVASGSLPALFCCLMSIDRMEKAATHSFGHDEDRGQDRVESGCSAADQGCCGVDKGCPSAPLPSSVLRHKCRLPILPAIGHKLLAASESADGMAAAWAIIGLHGKV